MIKEADQQGGLHFTMLHSWVTHVIQQLLAFDISLAYMKDNAGMTALLVAINECHLDAFQVIVTSCPDCCEVVDDRGRNLFHHMAVTKNFNGYDDDFKSGYWSYAFSNLLNEKDNDGNTPIHLFSGFLVKGFFFLDHPRLDKMAHNKENMDAFDIASLDANVSKSKSERVMGHDDQERSGRGYYGGRRILNRSYNRVSRQSRDLELRKVMWKSKENMMTESSGAHLIVVSLIAIVTFAADFTVPEGFTDPNVKQPGTATLSFCSCGQRDFGPRDKPNTNVSTME